MISRNSHRKSIFVVVIALTLSTLSAQAQESDASAERPANTPRSAQQSMPALTPPPTQKDDRFFTTLPRNPMAGPRGIFLYPALSFVLPGFDQWIDGRYAQAATFTGTALGGLGLAIHAGRELVEDSYRQNDFNATDFDSRNDNVRNFILGNQLYMAAGSFSAFTSYRVAVNTRRQLGEYSFLPDEDVSDVLTAPFDFQYLKRPSTFIPLAIAAGLVALHIDQTSSSSGRGFTGADLGYATSFSFLAGTNEEALFRGYMMPTYMQAWDSPFWSNTVTAFVFALAHLSPENKVPWPQFVLGWHLGDITQKDNWSIREATFLHTWWDIIIFTGTYIADSQQGREAWIRTPVFQATF